MRGFPDLPLVDDAPLLVLDESGTSVERRLVEQWLDGAMHDHGAPVELVRGGGAFADRLPDLTENTLVTPVRVAWLPRERGGVRRASWSDVLRLTNPRRPSRSAQERIAAREPDRCAIVVAQPAEVSVLRSRWREHRGGDSADTGAFAGFVTRQATLALDRAERAVPGTGQCTRRGHDPVQNTVDVEVRPDRDHRVEQRVAARRQDRITPSVGVETHPAIVTAGPILRPVRSSHRSRTNSQRCPPAHGVGWWPDWMRRSSTSSSTTVPRPVATTLQPDCCSVSISSTSNAIWLFQECIPMTLYGVVRKTTESSMTT